MVHKEQPQFSTLQLLPKGWEAKGGDRPLLRLPDPKLVFCGSSKVVGTQVLSLINKETKVS